MPVFYDNGHHPSHMVFDIFCFQVDFKCILSVCCCCLLFVCRCVHRGRVVWHVTEEGHYIGSEINCGDMGDSHSKPNSERKMLHFRDFN